MVKHSNRAWYGCLLTAGKFATLARPLAVSFLLSTDLNYLFFFILIKWTVFLSSFFLIWFSIAADSRSFFFPEFHQVRAIAEASFSGIKLKLAAFRYISDGNFVWTLLDELLSSNITLHTISDVWATLQMLARSGVPNVWQIACTVHCLNLRSWYLFVLGILFQKNIKVISL